MLRLVISIWYCLIIFFFFFHNNSHVVFSSSSSARCHPDESSALLQLNATTPIRVTCDEATGYVVGLDIYGYSNNITTNCSLFLLHHLQRLYVVGDNKIAISEDAFKALAQNLTRLEVLGLESIDMSSVPLSALMNISSSLTILALYCCQLYGDLPGNLFHSFPKLERIRIFSSGRIRISESAFREVSNLTHLRELYLFRIDMSSVPPILLTNLSSSLTYLELPECQLRGEFPYNGIFHSFPKLESIVLSSNNLTGDVEFAELSKLKKLRILDLSFNNVSILSSHNSINSTLENLSSLRMSSCHITEFPHFLKFSKHLKVLDLSNNQIQGSVPTWFWESNKDSLDHLNLSYNSLTHIHQLPWKNLTFLDLHSNLFSGPLPILSPILKVFLVSKNKFSGEIPISICNLTTVNVLDLSYNNFTGNIPRCIGNFTEYLSVLDLRRNKLHGTIPEILSTGIWLRSLNLNGNHLEGALPRSLVNCSKLEVLDLGNNMLNDTFPDWLASLPMLQVLVLRAKRFHGSIGNPGPGFPFFTLRIIDLSHNEFVGALPTKYFDNFKAMQRDLENTKLGYMGEAYYQDSVVVTVKGNDLELVKVLTIFTTIDFSKNKFTGEIPELLGKLKSLKGLNLSHNMLTGILPSSLGNLSNIEWLDLSSNDLVGKIPLSLADITFLSFLNLSHNHLEGPIPVGKQFNTFGNESYMGNSGLCGFPLTKTCGKDDKPSPPTLELNDGHDSSITNGFNWKIVMMGYASGLVIGISIGYMVLYSNGKLSWLSDTILEELQYRTRPSRPKRSRNARRS